MGTKTRFEDEAKGNSEMAYYFSDDQESEWLANIDRNLLDKSNEEKQLDEFRSASHTSVTHSP